MGWVRWVRSVLVLVLCWGSLSHAPAGCHQSPHRGVCLSRLPGRREKTDVLMIPLSDCSMYEPIHSRAYVCQCVPGEVVTILVDYAAGRDHSPGRGGICARPRATPASSVGKAHAPS